MSWLLKAAQRLINHLKSSCSLVLDRSTYFITVVQIVVSIAAAKHLKERWQWDHIFVISAIMEVSECEKKSKGRGFVYARANQRVKTKGDTLYLKCKSRHCDGSVLTPQQNSPIADTCEVCLLEPRSCHHGVALVPCRHSRFCSPCTGTVGEWLSCPPFSYNRGIAPF